MIQISYHQGYVAEISAIMDYDLGDLLNKIAVLSPVLEDVVKRDSSAGITFFRLGEDGKLHVITNFIKIGYNGVDLSPTDLLWVQIVPVENAYMAKFLTPASVATMKPEDIANIKIHRPISKWRKAIGFIRKHGK